MKNSLTTMNIPQAAKIMQQRGMMYETFMTVLSMEQQKSLQIVSVMKKKFKIALNFHMVSTCVYG